MKFNIQAAMLAALATCATVPAIPALAQVSPEYANSKIIILENKKGDKGYWTTTSTADPEKPVPPERLGVRDRMMKRRVLENYAEFLSPLNLPRKIRLFASDCKGAKWDSPYYLDKLQWIDMCYSFIGFAESGIDELIQSHSKEKWWTPSSREQLVAGMFASVLLHETGHALYHLLDVPIFGRQEDAADQMAAFIPLQFNKETARTAIKGFVYLWAYASMVRKADPPTQGKKEGNCPDPFCAFSDEHGTASQRMYNTVCIAYGGQPENFQDLVDAGLLPVERAKTCARDYQQVRHAFVKSVLPFINRDQMEKVKRRTWFQPEELQERK
jgi:hypothetical protein